MTMLRSIMAGALAVTLATACSDSTAPEDVTADDLVGSWRATAATFTPDGGTPVDLLAGGSSIVVVMLPSGESYTFVFTDPSIGDEAEHGSYSVSAGVLTLTASSVFPAPGEIPGPRTFDIVSLVGDILTLSDPDAVEDDVTGTLSLVLQRQESVGD